MTIPTREELDRAAPTIYDGPNAADDMLACMAVLRGAPKIERSIVSSARTVAAIARRIVADDDAPGAIEHVIAALFMYGVALGLTIGEQRAAAAAAKKGE